MMAKELKVNDFVRLKPNYYPFRTEYKITKIKSLASCKLDKSLKQLVQNLQPAYRNSQGHHLGYQDDELIAEIKLTKGKNLEGCWVPLKCLEKLQ